MRWTIWSLCLTTWGREEKSFTLCSIEQLFPTNCSQHPGDLHMCRLTSARGQPHRQLWYKQLVKWVESSDCLGKQCRYFHRTCTGDIQRWGFKKWPGVGAKEQDTNLMVRRLAEKPGGTINALDCMKAGIRVHPAIHSLLIMVKRPAKNSCYSL